MTTGAPSIFGGIFRTLGCSFMSVSLQVFEKIIIITIIFDRLLTVMTPEKTIFSFNLLPAPSLLFVYSSLSSKESFVDRREFSHYSLVRPIHVY
jgi:hypothetical protein